MPQHRRTILPIRFLFKKVTLFHLYSIQATTYAYQPVPRSLPLLTMYVPVALGVTSVAFVSIRGLLNKRNIIFPALRDRKTTGPLV